MRILVIVVLISLSVLKTIAQDSIQIYGLEEIKSYAIKHNYELKNAGIEESIAKQKIWEVTASGLPQVSANLDYNYFLDIPTQLMPDFITPAVIGTNMQYFGLTPTAPPPSMDSKMPVQFGSKHKSTWGVSASQLIFSGSYIVGLQTSKIYLALAQQNKIKTQQEIVKTVTDSYYLYLSAVANEMVLDSSLQNTQKTLAELEAMHTEGFIEDTDVDQIKITITNLKNSLQTIKQQKEIILNLLKFQMGMPIENKIQIQGDIYEILEEQNIESILSMDYNANSDVNYKIIETQEKLTELSLKNEKAAYLPTMSAFYSYSKDAQRNEFDFFNSDEDWFPSSIVGLTVKIPVFNSGQKHAIVKQAKMELDKIQNSKKQVLSGLIVEEKKTKAAFVNAWNNYNMQVENKILAKRIYTKTLIKYKEGMATSSALTQAHNQYLNSETAVINAISELLSIKNQLDKIYNQ